jgi:hypothetical protein
MASSSMISVETYNRLLSLDILYPATTIIPQGPIQDDIQWFHCWFIDEIKEEEHRFLIKGQSLPEAFQTILENDNVKEWFLGLKLLLEGEDDAETIQGLIRSLEAIYHNSISTEQLKTILEMIATTSGVRSQYGPFHLIIEEWEPHLPPLPQTNYPSSQSHSPVPLLSSNDLDLSNLPILEDDIDMD